jgi:hypothetical protein
MVAPTNGSPVAASVTLPFIDCEKDNEAERMGKSKRNSFLQQLLKEEPMF